jgi:MoaA/NifB/PqqE/SkfB family radical SAM enzyme
MKPIEGLRVRPLTYAEIASQQALKAKKPLVYDKVIKFDDMLEQRKSIALIQLQYKYNCNFHCSFCSIAGLRERKYERVLDIETVKRVFDEADAYGLAHMGLSGGEPLCFDDFEGLVEAVGADRFHIQLDTNGFLFTKRNAARVKALGIDKVQISIEGLDEVEHDKAVCKPGSHKRCLEAIDNVLDVGLQLQVSTVVWHSRVTSGDFESFIKYMYSRNAPVSAIYAKPVGAFRNQYDELCTPEDIRYVKKLLREYGGYDHSTANYGRDLGCTAVKRIISITASGEVLPCPWMYWSLGNIFEQPLADILDKGMRYFGERNPVCRLSEDVKFYKRYAHLGSDDLPPIELVMGETNGTD